MARTRLARATEAAAVAAAAAAAAAAQTQPLVPPSALPLPKQVSGEGQLLAAVTTEQVAERRPAKRQRKQPVEEQTAEVDNIAKPRRRRPRQAEAIVLKTEYDVALATTEVSPEEVS